MAAASTDKFKKLARRWVGQVGSGSIADGVVTTVPLSSVTNLPTDTGVVVVVDRVDASGVATPQYEETIYGVVSGTNLVTCTRGVEGTAQAHSAGAVVEVLFVAKSWADVVDGLLVEHNQDGTHKTTVVTTLTATQTLTNKRITPRSATTASSATPAINTDTTDIFTITALAVAITSMTTSLSGTPTNGQKLIIRFLDNGTARAISWGASFASRGATLPITTVLSKYMYVGLIYNSTASVWDCVAVVNEA